MKKLAIREARPMLYGRHADHYLGSLSCPHLMVIYKGESRAQNGYISLLTFFLHI